MLTYLFKSFRAEHAPAVAAAEPKNDLMVVDEKDKEDDYCEITVRPMTWSEVAGNGVKGRVIVSSRTPTVAEAMPAIELYPSPAAIRSSAFESNELYGDVEEALEGKLSERIKRRRKSHGRRKQAA